MTDSLNSGFSGPTVCRLTGVTYRQLDYWARTDLVTPSITPANGSGSKRSYSYSDVLEVKVIKSLLNSGVALTRARQAVECLRNSLGADLASSSLVMSDTGSVLAHDDGDLVDLLRGGQGVFNIVPLANVVAELTTMIRQANNLTLEKEHGVTIQLLPGDPRRRHPSTSTKPVDRFAHESERVFAQILNLYGHAWSYEPIEFPLEWNESGVPIKAFRPDFYLSESRTFIELTVLEQRLVTKKNQKVRRFRSLYPEVELVVVYQRDFAALLKRHRLGSIGDLAA